MDDCYDAMRNTANETVGEVMDYLLGDSPSLYALARCSRRLCTLAIPALYTNTQTLSLSTLSSEDSFTKTITGFHPATYVTSLSINDESESDREFIILHLSDAMKNISNTHSSRALQSFSYMSRSLPLHEAWRNHRSLSFNVVHAVLQCPLTAGVGLSIMNALLSTKTRTVSVDWSRVQRPVTYTTCSMILKFIGSLAYNVMKITIKIPAVETRNDCSTLQTVLDEGTLIFPSLTHFIFDEIHGELSLANFFARHQSLIYFGYSGIQSNIAVIDGIAEGSILRNVHVFYGNAFCASIVAGLLPWQLTELALVSPSSNVFHPDLGCRALRQCRALRVLKLLHVGGISASQLQVLSDYVPDINVLHVVYTDLLQTTSDANVCNSDLVEFYATIFICFSSLVDLTVSVNATNKVSAAGDHRSAALHSLLTYGCCTKLSVLVNDLRTHSYIFCLFLDKHDYYQFHPHLTREDNEVLCATDVASCISVCKHRGFAHVTASRFCNFAVVWFTPSFIRQGGYFAVWFPSTQHHNGEIRDPTPGSPAEYS
ncbi:hypothetical protein C8J55DRAFT_557592 [Lentinula edodes]|uniref:Uncharacterized protein n=1 Tax=Lentinula lateritia TaxID=40482 RepID=A0A9W9DYH3_9AGAR|nr:hypothetical protein C8J55DRAFT_557592 [Lentinula edodes]